MKKTHFYILLGISLFIILLLPYFLFRTNISQEELESTLTEYAEQNLFTEMYKRLPPETGQTTLVDFIAQSYYKNCIQLLKTKYGHEEIEFININLPPQSNAINLYFFTEDPKGKLEPFRNNCTYTGYKNIIICDATFLREKVLQIKSLGGESNPFEILRTNELQGVVIWVIGHEIGHIAHDHSGKNFNFNGERWNFGIIKDSLISDKLELEADEFAIEAIGNETVGTMFWIGLSTLSQKPELFGAKVQEDGKIILERTSLTHPPLYFRLIQLAINTIKSGLVEDTSGHFTKIKSNIIIE